MAGNTGYQKTTSPGLAAWRGLTIVGAPAISAWLAYRAARGKEDPARAGERRGIAGRPRPAGPLVWVHAASVGEAVSVLPLVERLVATRPGLGLLMTTGTVTSAALMALRLPAAAIHQYAPVDHPSWVARFLDHWRPDLALWVESELWPNLVSATQTRGTRMILVNGRMSDRSYRRWQRLSGLVRPMLAGFDLCLGQSTTDAERFAALGATNARSVGNLKFAAPPLPADATALAEITTALGERPCWLAASTHPGEEETVARAHERLRARHPELITLLVPRHAGRGAAIAKTLSKSGLVVARRAAGEPIAPGTDVYIGDTMGELGLFYRAAEVVFMGGSLVPHGGQNLLEPAKLESAILHGPHVDNFRTIVDAMRRAGATVQVTGASDLAVAVDALLSEPALRRARARAAAEVAASEAGVLDAIMAEIAPWLDREPSPVPNADPTADPTKRHARA